MLFLWVDSSTIFEVPPVQAQIPFFIDILDPVDKLIGQLNRCHVLLLFEEVFVDIIVLMGMLYEVLYEAFIREFRDLALLLSHNLFINQLNEDRDLRLHLLVGSIDLMVDAKVEVLHQLA